MGNVFRGSSRTPLRTTQARRRRVQNAFQPPGFSAFDTIHEVSANSFQVVEPIEFLISTLTENTTITIPRAGTKFYQSNLLHVKRFNASSDEYTLTLVPVSGSGETIDGENSYVVTAHKDTVSVYSDGSNWKIFCGTSFYSLGQPKYYAVTGNATINADHFESVIRVNHSGADVHLTFPDPAEVTQDGAQLTVVGWSASYNTVMKGAVANTMANTGTAATNSVVLVNSVGASAIVTHVNDKWLVSFPV